MQNNFLSVEALDLKKYLRSSLKTSKDDYLKEFSKNKLSLNFHELFHLKLSPSFMISN